LDARLIHIIRALVHYKKRFVGFVLGKGTADVSGVVRELIEIIGVRSIFLKNFPQVQGAYFDVFVGIDLDENASGTCLMELDYIQFQVL